jgi:hypothetical protein
LKDGIGLRCGLENSGELAEARDRGMLVSGHGEHGSIRAPRRSWSGEEHVSYSQKSRCSKHALQAAPPKHVQEVSRNLPALTPCARPRSRFSHLPRLYHIQDSLDDFRCVDRGESKAPPTLDSKKTTNVEVWGKRTHTTCLTTSHSPFLSPLLPLLPSCSD